MFGLVILSAANMQEIIFFTIPFLIVCLLIFFPSTTAMFSMVRKWTMNEKDIPFFRSFFKYFKNNYIQSIIAGIIIELIWVVFIADYHYVTEYFSALTFLFIILTVYLLMISLFFLANIVHYEITAFAAFKNAAIMVITNPISSFSLGAFSLFLIYFSLSFANFLIPFFTGVIVVFVTFTGYYRIYLKIEQLKQETR